MAMLVAIVNLMLSYWWDAVLFLLRLHYRMAVRP